MASVIFTTLFALALLPILLAGVGIIKTTKGKKSALILNIILTFSVCFFSFAFILGGTVSAAKENQTASNTQSSANVQKDAAEAVNTQTSGNKLADISVGAGLGMLAAAIAISVSCIGAGIAVAASATAAIGAISENPKTFGKAMIFVALAEGVALYGLIISIQILSVLQ